MSATDGPARSRERIPRAGVWDRNEFPFPTASHFLLVTHAIAGQRRCLSPQKLDVSRKLCGDKRVADRAIVRHGNSEKT